MIAFCACGDGTSDLYDAAAQAVKALAARLDKAIVEEVERRNPDTTRLDYLQKQRETLREIEDD